MMNFINFIPTNIGWMLVGVVAAILLYFVIDIIRMVIINIAVKLKKDENESPCPLCGQMIEPSDESEDSYIYRCPHCGTQWNEKW